MYHFCIAFKKKNSLEVMPHSFAQLCKEINYIYQTNIRGQKSFISSLHIVTPLWTSCHPVVKRSHSLFLQCYQGVARCQKVRLTNQISDIFTTADIAVVPAAVFVAGKLEWETEYDMLEEIRWLYFRVTVYLISSKKEKRFICRMKMKQHS